MRNICFLLLCSALFVKHTTAQVPDTVRVGIYITSIHDIDFKLKEYSMNFWLWFTHKNPEFNFPQNLEIPQAKTFTKSYMMIDTLEDGRIYTLMKLQCVMKDAWNILNFPFDRQRLWLSIENAMFDAESFVFLADTSGYKYDPRFAISGWNIDSLKITTGIKNYETSFGDDALEGNHSEYATYRVKVVIKREPWGLFFKIFLGMYVSFLIVCICFFIHADSMESRFGLSVGALFAAIGNKYVIDSSLPETSSFTLVDTLHALTLLFIFAVISISAVALHLMKKDKLEKANRMDMKWAWILFSIYVIFNAFFIVRAVIG